eukprot:XP_014008260.1 PREDICTED: uncharacterized protein LOC106575994 isoform X1 [Salmo salar]
MVVANNTIRLQEIQNHIIADNTIFNNIHQVGLSTLDRVLQRNRKQVYRVPFERNSESVKEQLYEYVQRVLELDAAAIQHVYIYIDEAGFSLAKRRGQGRNIIGHGAIVNVPGQPLAHKAFSITMPTLVPTTLPFSSHSWTHYMASSFQTTRGVDHSSPGMLSSGTT